MANGTQYAYTVDSSNGKILKRASEKRAGLLPSEAPASASDLSQVSGAHSGIGLDRAKQIAQRTLRIVRQNIVLALAVKFLVLILGAFGYANMWMAIFADVGVMVIAVLNAMRATRA